MTEITNVAEEIGYLRKTHPKIKIQSATNEFISASYERTPSSRIKVTLTFPEGYPNHALIVDVANVPAGLKKKLEKDLGAVAIELKDSFQQIDGVFMRLVNFVDTNMFVPCWKELRQCVDLIQKNDSTIAINDAKGLIKLRLNAKKYFYICTIIIDEGYPTTKMHENYGQPCKLKINLTNLPVKIQSMLTSQAKELARRMQDGMTAEKALKMSNPIQAPKSMSEIKAPPKVRLTQQALKGLKKDTETLKYVRDLREVNVATVQGNATIKTHAARERKDARRTLGKITKKEIAADKTMEAKELQWQLEEKARMEGYNIDEYDGSNPQPCLLSLVTFLINKIQRLPDEVCPVCSELALPAEPKELHDMYAPLSKTKSDSEKRALRLARLKRPTRTYCGCWYHYGCLDKLMTEPPFGASCPAESCGRRVYHPDWSGDITELERAWAANQARQREIQDASLFL